MSTQAAIPEHDAELALLALKAVRRGLDANTSAVPIAVEGEGPVEVPRAAMELLAKILGSMSAGAAVTIVPAHAELTTHQAAEVLNVSRPFVIKLLDAGEIEFRKVGSHRRIRADSLLAFKRRDDLARRDALGELVELSQEMGERE